MSGDGTFRVTVRGRFDELSERAHAYLDRACAEHDIFLSAYTPPQPRMVLSIGED